MKDTVKLFKAIGDETRINILILLSKKNICAKGIAKHLGISEAAVSQHIKVLKDVNLIVGYKKGYFVVYDLNKKVLEDSINFIKLLINEDLGSIKEQLNLDIKDFNNENCKNHCRKMQGCCKSKFREE